MNPDLPDFYVDGVQLGLNPFGVILMCTRQTANAQPSNVPHERVCNVRMSLEHAKVLAIMLTKQLRAFEQGLGTEIPLHPSLWQQLGLSRKEDW